MTYGYGKILTVVSVLVLLVLFALYSFPTEMIGGSRSAIFSRFTYQPDPPYMSTLDTVDPDRFSKTYNTAGPTKFIMGRPYKYYKTKNRTWLYPWSFPQEINTSCIMRANDQCEGENLIMIKQSEEKLGGLGVATPQDIFRGTPCFNKVYEACLKDTKPPPNLP